MIPLAGARRLSPCDESVAVALPVSRRCQFRPVRRLSRRALSSRLSSGSGPITRCSTHRGEWSGAPSRTSGSTTGCRADGCARRGRTIAGRTDRSLRSTSTSDTCSNFRFSAERLSTCDTHASQTPTRSTLCSWRQPRRSRRSRWPVERSTYGKPRNSLQLRTRGANGSQPHSASTTRQSDRVWSRPR